MSAFQQVNISLLRFDWMLLLLPLPFLFGMLLDALAWKTLLPQKLKINLVSLFFTHIGAEAVLLSIPGGFAMADAIKVYLLRHRSDIPANSVITSLIMRHWMLGITQLFFITGSCLIGSILNRDHMLSIYSHNISLAVAIGILAVVSVFLGIIVKKLIQGSLARTIWKYFYSFKIPGTKKTPQTSCNIIQTSRYAFC